MYFLFIFNIGNGIIVLWIEYRRENMKNKKKTMIGILSILVCVMAIGYALLTQELTINGSASIDSLWKVEITNIESRRCSK